MGTVHGVGRLVAHVSGLSPVSSSSFGTDHLSVLHPDNIDVVFIRAVWVDCCERLGPSVGGRGPPVASCTLHLHVPGGASRSVVPLPVLHALILRKGGSVGAFLGILIPNPLGIEHILRCAASTMATELIIHLIGAELSLLLNLNGDALFVPHAGTPLAAWMLGILIIQQWHGRTIYEPRQNILVRHVGKCKRYLRLFKMWLLKHQNSSYQTHLKEHHLMSFRTTWKRFKIDILERRNISNCKNVRNGNI